MGSMLISETILWKPKKSEAVIEPICEHIYDKCFGHDIVDMGCIDSTESSDYSPDYITQ